MTHRRTIKESTTAGMRFNEAPPGTMATNEADTNADTCCLGKNFLILSHTTRVADVYAYDKAIAPIENVPIVTGATAYDCPVTQATYILVEATNELRIRLTSKGTKIVFDSRVPTQDELVNCEHIEMTSQRPWEPTDVRLSVSTTSRKSEVRNLPWKRSISSTMMERITIHSHDRLARAEDVCIYGKAR